MTTDVRFFGIPIRASDAVAPEEVILLSPKQVVRWTPDGGVEEMEPWQAEPVRRSLREEEKRGKSA